MLIKDEQNRYSNEITLIEEIKKITQGPNFHYTWNTHLDIENCPSGFVLGRLTYPETKKLEESVFTITLNKSLTFDKYFLTITIEYPVPQIYKCMMNVYDWDDFIKYINKDKDRLYLNFKQINIESFKIPLTNFSIEGREIRISINTLIKFKNWKNIIQYIKWTDDLYFLRKNLRNAEVMIRFLEDHQVLEEKITELRLVLGLDLRHSKISDKLMYKYM